MISPLFPEFKHNDTVALIGFAATSRAMAPYGDPTVDLWSINEAYKQDWFKSTPTGWMQLHPRWDFMRKNNRNDPDHWEWLRQPHEFPIWMVAQFKDIPNSVRYPIEEAYELSRGYLTSTFSYMMALAILMGYKRIELYGFEMAVDSDYVYQKAGAEYLIGVAQGKGIEVVLPENCSLLRGNLYGYEDLRAADRTYLGMSLGLMKEEEKTRLHMQYFAEGRVSEMIDLLKDPELPKEVRQFAGAYLGRRMEQRDNEYKTAIGNASVAKGARVAIENHIMWHDSQNIPADREDRKVSHE
jgi:hypothetical protein